jgi:hypothetical protein
MGGVRALVHEPSHSIVRCSDGRAQILREGREIADVRTSNALEQLSIARDGTLFVGEFLDLHAARPEPRWWEGIASTGVTSGHRDESVRPESEQARARRPWAVRRLNLRPYHAGEKRRTTEPAVSERRDRAL